MIDAKRTRRQPTQARSRRTVERILDAAEAIVGESGVDAATTRAISERAGVSAPSLYRFFADRDEILDSIIQRGVRDLDAHAQAAESGWHVNTVDAFVRLEVDLHVTYYEQHPIFVRLWFGGRASKPVVDEVRARNHTLAARARAALIGAGLVEPDTPPDVFDMLVELGDRVLDVAFRDSPTADRRALDLGVAALTALLERWAIPARA